MNAQKHTLTCILSCGLAFGLGCNEQSQTPETEDQTSAEEGKTEGQVGQPQGQQQPGQQQGQELGREQILGILQTANRGEIEAATYAQENAPQQEVKDLAEHIQEDHAQALAQENQLAQQMNVQADMESQKAQQLQEDSQRMMQQLRDQNGPDVGTTWVRTQVQAHQQTLRTIDQDLLPAAQSEVASHIRQVRGKVQEHLTALQRLESQMQQQQPQQQPQGR